MLPHLFTIGGYSQSTYGLLVALAFVAALSLSGRLAKEAGLQQEDVLNLGMYCAIAGIVGAKLLMLTHIGSIGEIFTMETLRAGGDFFGGLILALIVAGVYMRRKHLPLLPTADVYAPGLALGHGIGRLGCFAAGCCYGVRTHLPWAVTFTNPDSNGAPLNVPIHPTQLYEALAEFMIFVILLWRIRKPHVNGAIISLYLILYGTARFLVEFVRFHEQGNLFGGPLDTSQYIALVLIALGAAFTLRHSASTEAMASASNAPSRTAKTRLT
jgi:phosphatidylglycerol---prolipoprotein diacylglyceryl transferase